jgi:hypothetical protein
VKKAFFLGVTPAEFRAPLAACLLKVNPERFYFPCAGRFTMPEVLARMQVDPSKLYCSDISLFSSMVGYLCDPTLDWDALGLVCPTDEFKKTDAPIDQAAEVLTLIRISQQSTRSEYAAQFHRDLMAGRATIRAKFKTFLDSVSTRLRGMHFEMRDVWEVVREVAPNEKYALYTSPPGYTGGYDYSAPGLSWNAPAIRQFEPIEFQNIIAELTPAKAAIFLHLHQDLTRHAHPNRELFLEQIPEGWTALVSVGRSSDRIDHVVANRTPAMTVAVLPKMNEEIEKFPIYNDEEITESTKLEFRWVNRETALYYRDLFVHKLGITDAECFALMLVDGRVTTSMGFNTEKLCRFASEYINETFGISVTSKRYARLGKLFMLALTSGSARRFFLRRSKASLYGLRTAKGIRTSSITTYHEGKTDRSVMTLESRTPMEDGRFLLVYATDFRDDSFDDVVKMWLQKWGATKRKSSV